MKATEADYFNKSEIDRVYELISLNDKSLKPFFEDDINLIKTNPSQYWNSFLLNCEEEDVNRHNTIIKMQLFYQQKTLFD